MAAGLAHSLGLKSDGSVVGWGWNDAGECNAPAPNSDFVAIAAGSQHSVGLRSNGSIAAWGSNGSGQCDVPAPNGDFVAVTAGGNKSFGLKSNGSIVAWGWDDGGQYTVPTPNSRFVALASGGGHCLALSSDGSVVAWGGNGYGECTVPAPNCGFVAVTAGEDVGFSLGLIPSPVVSSLAINGGVAATTSRTVVLNNACTTATQYMASEAPGFAGESWQPYATSPPFTLSDGYGTKTVWFRVARYAGLAWMESAVTSDTITLSPAGAVCVAIFPQAAVDAGAQWRRPEMTAWLDCGATEPLVPTGLQQVQFRPLRGWVAPKNVLVTVSENETAEASGLYTREPASWTLK